MANNRIYLVCDVCEDGTFSKAVYLGKRLGGGYYQHAHHVPTADQWEEFYTEHEWCGNTLDHFSIKYECRRDTEDASP